jgi:hypothetical protein
VLLAESEDVRAQYFELLLAAREAQREGERQAREEQREDERQARMAAMVQEAVEHALAASARHEPDLTQDLS